MISIEQKPLISRYRIKSRGFLNAVSGRREFEGALIRIGDGFGCIHPWPELGDPPLEKCLADLQGPRFWPIVRRAIRCAEYDEAARSREESLFEEMEIPLSHATITDARPSEIAKAVEAGFTVVKLKGGRDLRKESDFLQSMRTEFPELKWRIDFNESLTPAQASDFLLGLSEKTRAAVDFIEDPTPYSDSAWTDLFRKARVPLAVDHEAAPNRPGAKVMVIKPAVDEPFLLAEAANAQMQRVVLTSYMDHPFGQTFAAWEAARLELQFPGISGVCGLQTHHLFEAGEFSEQLGPSSPNFTPPPGTGLGFDDLLDALPWTRLY
jgi:O-succinylbenzoate synthase